MEGIGQVVILLWFVKAFFRLIWKRATGENRPDVKVRSMGEHLKNARKFSVPVKESLHKEITKLVKVNVTVPEAELWPLAFH